MTRIISILLAASLFASAAERQHLKARHIPAAANAASLVGRLEETNTLHLAICLPLRNEPQLNALLADIYNPSSPNYRHWLTNGEFAQKFGPTTNDYEAVASWASNNNFKIVMRHDGRTSLSVKASVLDVEKVLGVRMNKHRHPRESRNFYAPDREPTVSLSVPILGILGLDNLSTTTNCSHIQTTATVPTSGSGPSGNYMGYDFRNAYVPGTALTGSGQHVGILAFYSIYTSDLSAYQAATGLPAMTYSVENIDGGPTSPDPEAALDFDMVWSMAPGCQIKLYQGPSLITSTGWSDVLTVMANENVCKQMTCSYIIYDVSTLTASEANTYYIFEQMSAQGQSFFTSSGDQNAYIASVGQYADPYPAIFTNITVVGGTALTMNGSGASWASETTWNQGSSGTGGGYGVGYYYIPAYQMGISMAANGGSTVIRNYPDVALTAQNVWVIYNGTGIGVSGTSCATPLWSGFCALINQQAAANSKPTVGWLNPSIYAIGKSVIYTNCFHDIVTGNNKWSSSPSLFSAVAGYDLCTGWGTPNGTNLINVLYTGPSIVSLVFSNGLFQRAY